MSKRYTEEYKNTIVELYNSGKTLAELNSEYGLPKSTILTWVKKAEPIAVDNNKTITQANYQAMLKKMARIEEENEILKVSRSSYYKHLNKKESNRSIENRFLVNEILNIYKASKFRYGAPKIYEKLRANGVFISLKRTQRLMNKLGIKSIVCKKFRPYSSKNKVESRENIINRDFSTTRINQK